MTNDQDSANLRGNLKGQSTCIYGGPCVAISNSYFEGFLQLDWGDFGDGLGNCTT
jgi:hypothetical protein